MKETIKEEEDLTIKFLYDTFLGRILLLFITRVTFSKIITNFLDSRYSIILIKPFIKKYNIDTSLYENKKYKSFNEYFIRNKKEEYINIDKNINDLISPCDCKLSAYNVKDNIFKVKHVSYNLELLLKDKSLAEEYKNDYVIVCRLSPDNYHRYCYIDNGYHINNKKIRGKLDTVRPEIVGKEKVYVTNSRSYTVLNTDNFGKVIQVEVGALMVGKIKNNYKEHEFTKGEEKGYFKYGGSTIILLVKKDKVKIDNYLINNTKNGYETIINIGDKIGVKKDN